jgi:hypothetical protein
MPRTHPGATRVPGRALLPLLLLIGLLAAVAPAERAEASTRTPVMRQSLLTPAQMTAWFRAHEPSGSVSRATVSVSELTRLFVEEGRAEGVAGDIAFAQTILETGWLRWPSGQVKPSQNNFSGIGACDGGTCTVASFPSARIGVRAQIQHLRAYADATVTVDRLANPLESPRFHLVSPKGKAPYWEQFGGGVWATDPGYATKVLGLYHSMLRYNGVGGLTSATDPLRFADVPRSHTHAVAIESMAERGVTQGCGDGSLFCPGNAVTREQMATFLTRAFELPAGRSGTFRDVGGVHAPGVDALAAAGVARGCAPDRFCPRDDLTRAQMASLLARTLELPAGTPSFSDVPRGSTHAGAIAAIAELGITKGCGGGRFCPDEVVTRAQMAAFLDRALTG